MSYVLLVIEPRGQRAARSKTEGKAAYAQMLEFAESLKRRGVLRAVESLAGDAAATRVSVRASQPALVDGPFSEAKEMLGGFFLVDCATREEALALAAECPAARWATIEVRETAPCYA
ncbi:MAG TPA: YciI family protein [Rudaea sp.]|nr:YciI family protein [Rudaea sp.]